MNAIDILLCIIVLLAAWNGWRKGFLAGILELVSWGLSLLIAYFSYPYVASFLQKYFSTVGVWSQPVAFIGILLIARLVMSIIVREVVIPTSPNLHRNAINHFFGIVPGVINGVIYAIFMAALLFAMPVNPSIASSTQKSKVAGELAGQVEWANEKLSPIFDDAIRASMIGKTVEAGPDDFIKLKFTVTNSKPRTDLEAQMLVMINEERFKAGLHPLKADPELTVVARAHSMDMFSRGYFSHYTPEKKDPFDRMKSAKVRFLSAGENLALGQTLEICHEGLMNSPGHRANILHPSFGRVGIGILDGGVYGIMISQEFRN
jgi:uncharacterized protein YkwD